MKILINADDFGASKKINQAIYSAMEAGWISSTTLLSGAPNIEEATEMSAGFGDISFGTHLALDGHYNVGTSENAIISNSKFRASNIKQLKRCNMSLIGDIADEYSLQIEKLIKYGIKISHLDTHRHSHLYIPSLLALVEAANRFNIKKIRCLKTPTKQSASKVIYRSLHTRYLKMKGFALPDFYCSFQQFKQLHKSNIENKTIEIMCHPGPKYNYEEFFNRNFYNSEIIGHLINYDDL